MFGRNKGNKSQSDDQKEITEKLQQVARDPESVLSDTVREGLAEQSRKNAQQGTNKKGPKR